MKTQMVPLGAVAEFVNGVAFKPEDWSGDGARPIIRIQNLNDPAKPFNRTDRDVPDKNLARPGDLLVSWSASLGVYEWTSEEACINQHIFKVIPDYDKVDHQYMRRALEASLGAMEAQVHGATMKHITRGKFLAVEIPLPLLSEQRRIAAILDKADALRAKRREAIAKCDQLLQSVFLEMFGDLTDCRLTVQDVVQAQKGSIRTGPFGSQLLHSEFTGSGVAVLGIDNAVSNEFRWGQRRYISESKYQQLSRYRVFPGDVLITIMGTCGRCAVVPEDVPMAINTKHLCCISLDPEKCDPEFLHTYFLHHPVARRFLEDRAKGAIMDGLNMGIIKELPIPEVPIEDQLQFARTKAFIRSRLSELNVQLTGIGDLFSSLQQRAFSGQLKQAV